MAKSTSTRKGDGEERCLNCRCVAKYIFAPFILIFQAFRIYVLGMIFAYIERIGRGVFCGLCVCCSCTYKDSGFPHDHRSIGTFKGKSGSALDKEIVWRRIGDVCSVAAPQTKGKNAPSGSKPKGTARLFADGISPSDICQGQLGDCWLMSALACLATQPGAIQQVFETREYNAFGRYKFRLFDGNKKKWRTVVVDDWIPCSAANGRPLFAKPQGDEAWVVLLEKAMAKFMGKDYASLDGNLMIKALEVLTGDFVCMFRLGDIRDAKSRGKPRLQQLWTRLELSRGPPPKNSEPGDDLRLVYARDDPFNQELMFRSIKWELRHGSTIGASNAGGRDTQSVNGIVQGHAYSIITVEEADDKRFLRLRNPWGTFEWKGAWSDKSPLWDRNPKVKAALEFKPTSDGSFWMEWTDFVQHFNTLEFCCRSTGFDHLVVNIHEEHPCCGPCWGCIEGCFRYWFCCLGCKALFCGRKVTKFKRPPQGCCGCV
ncbi:hypothetical protein PLESTB_001013700 [Pleodorina starrii]|uniref:Calpain catalytic domain-containing protein n=1 Tax=Pleodorina starrii TaxID=330485 RepID=A0A9W6F401_9CHLO|nr:hypothetical protein PLESTB_001013700 [Pleodorina starrii]GLC65428.1 hypothetical protein PLESTF_000292200 [Pleodorina starrii]